MPALQLVQINSTALTSTQTPPWDGEASDRGTFNEALPHLLSHSFVSCLMLKLIPLSQVKEEAGW